MKKAVSYVRVSSKEQKEEGYSIPAQKKLLRAYAKKHGFSVVEVYEDVETAKRAGRPEFERMVRFLKGNRGVRDVLVEKIDRLTRNFPDLVTLDALERNIHFVKEGQIIGPDTRSSDRLIYDIKVALAKNYIDNLSEETRKGLEEKAEQGLYPSYAPLGYVNDKESGGLQVDFVRATIIRELFEMYGGGGVSLRELTKIAEKKELRTRKGKPLHKSAIAKVLVNPIYVGDMMWKGVYYQGKHAAIVSVEVFEKVKRLLDGKGHVKKQRVFAYRGLLRCGNCGCLITAEIKKERYVYYRCTRGRKNCTEKPVREELLEMMLGEPLKRLRITEERREWIEQALRESFKDEKSFQARELRRLEGEYKVLEEKVDKLYDDKLNGVVPEAFWKRKYTEYVSRQKKIEEYIEEHKKAKVDYFENALRILELAQKAYSLYLNENSDEKRKFLDLVLSNCTLQGGKVSYEMNKAFAILADGAVEEEKLASSNLPFQDRNDMWVPKVV